MPVPGSTISPTADAETIEKRYYQCKCKDSSVRASLNYVCTSSLATGYLGSRYLRMADKFGKDRSLVSNLCDDAGLGPGLERLAEFASERIGHFCLLGALPADGEVRLAGRALLPASTDNPAGDYALVQAADCPAPDPASGRSENAIVLRAPPSSDTAVDWCPAGVSAR